MENECTRRSIISIEFIDLTNVEWISGRQFSFIQVGSPFLCLMDRQCSHQGDHCHLLTFVNKSAPEHYVCLCVCMCVSASQKWIIIIIRSQVVSLVTYIGLNRASIYEWNSGHSTSCLIIIISMVNGRNETRCTNMLPIIWLEDTKRHTNRVTIRIELGVNTPHTHNRTRVISICLSPRFVDKIHNRQWWCRFKCIIRMTRCEADNWKHSMSHWSLVGRTCCTHRHKCVLIEDTSSSSSSLNTCSSSSSSSAIHFVASQVWLRPV